MNPKDHFFGEVAIALKLLTRADVKRVMIQQKQHPESPIGQICCKIDLLREDQVARILTEQKRILVRRRSARVASSAPSLPSKASSLPASAPSSPSKASSSPPQASLARLKKPVAKRRVLPRRSTPTRDRHGDLLGRLAVDSGFLTMGQLGVLARQQGSRVHKLIGELLVEKGYASQNQVDDLLRTQTSLRDRTRQSRAVLDTIKAERPGDVLLAMDEIEGLPLSVDYGATAPAKNESSASSRRVASPPAARDLPPMTVKAPPRVPKALP
ncbi:MAG: hypothetical protein KAI47_26210, partial [Deltaproteobacteria bacterium]|nr:hypothetical protein [Deltaproteobacteria bacterium]